MDYIRLSLVVFAGLVLSCCCIDWIRKRNVAFYKVRSPLLMTISQIYTYISIVVTVFFIEDDSCLMMAIFFALLLPLSMGPMLMMVPQLLLNARVNNEKVNRSRGIVNKIWKYKFLIRTDVQFLIICLIASIHIGIHFLFSYFFTLEDNCYRLPLALFDAEMLFYFIPYGWLMNLLKEIEDPFHIRSHLIISWIITAPITVITILYPIILYIYFDFRYVYISSGVVMFIIMYLAPLFYRVRKVIPRSISLEFNIDIFNRFYDELLYTAEKNWASENVLFIRAIHNFKSMPTLDKAKGIYELYIRKNADMWVNLSYTTSSEIEKRIETHHLTYDLELFDRAENEIMFLIRTNIYPFI